MPQIKRNLFTLVLIASLPTNITNAAMIGTSTLVKNPPGNPFGAPDAALPAPWVALQIGIQTTAGELIGAVDVTVTGNVLHQRWNDSDFDGVTDPSPNGTASNGRGDSHLTAPAGSPFGAGPTETNTKAGSPLPSVAAVEYGVGNLSGAWGILAPAQTANLAYLVFRSDDIPSLQIAVKAATPTGAPILTTSGSDTLTNLDCPNCVPPDLQDALIDNVNANNPGMIFHTFASNGGQLPAYNLQFTSYTPAPGIPGTGPATAAYIDPPTQRFAWNTVGSPIGTYKWLVTGTNQYGTDQATLTVNITIPEPATVFLLGLAMTGCLGFIRRRAV